MDPEAALSAQPGIAERRAALVARAATERENVARQLAPIGTLDRWLERLESVKDHLPGLSMGTGLGLSALLLALPIGKLKVVRGGIAAFNLFGSLRKLFSRS